MHIEHIAIWTGDLERLKEFYSLYFRATSGNKYTNPRTGFQSYFLTFASGARLEIMSLPSINRFHPDHPEQQLGLAHVSFSTGSQEAVDILTNRLKEAGYRVWDGPRWTGDGYYESQVSDPDGNRIEITV